ncbi:HXXXD-type acyl-transferase family protein [Abeliophyllum distichum]|uniref:HXXXD-type acyl-transferase family protein n=1 Tax=Abeliophyllum distichum TaxID=126358 RepID=A0ABD1Q1M9_9LAMI
MAIQIDIISRENIKPSSPTPLHLQTFNFSLLDQILPSYFHPAVLYFLPEATDSIDASQRTQILKHSLSLILTRFYPFAGIIADSFSINCNDDGVPFVVAKVKGQLSDFLKIPDLHLVQNFLPNELSWILPGSNVSMIQVNYFDCGGMIIGVIVSHGVADGTTLSTFLKAWAATTAGRFDEAGCPNYIAQSLFPRSDKISTDSRLYYTLERFLITGNYITRRYIFDSSAISMLKAKSGVKNPTRIEVVTALIWKCFMAACANKLPSLMTHSVNLRSRAVPPFAPNCFGNLLWFAAAAAQGTEGTTDQADLVTKVRESIRRIDVDFMKRMQGDEGLIGYKKNLEETKEQIPEEANCLYFSSWCRFGVYDTDFGWGKPIWVANSVSTDSYSPKLNNVMLLDTRFGDGIEVWVTLEEQYAAAFEESEELRTLTSIDPSPLEFDSRNLHL